MASDAANQRVNLPEDPSKGWYDHYRFKLGRDSPSDARNTLLVVATLIAAVTFQAGVNPPGGVWQDDSGGHSAGKSILGSNKRSYTVFIFSNTLAYASAVQIIVLLVIGCPFQTEILIALSSMSFTYAASIASVEPSGVVSSRYLFLVFFTPFLLRSAMQIRRRFK